MADYSDDRVQVGSGYGGGNWAMIWVWAIFALEN